MRGYSLILLGLMVPVFGRMDRGRRRSVRAWGTSVPLAYTLQASLLGTLAATLAWLWHSDAAFELKTAALAVAACTARRGAQILIAPVPRSAHRESRKPDLNGQGVLQDKLIESFCARAVR